MGLRGFMFGVLDGTPDGDNVGRLVGVEVGILDAVVLGVLDGTPDGDGDDAGLPVKV